jgi:hypothetical protein
VEPGAGWDDDRDSPVAPFFLRRESSCGEGACSRWAAQQPQSSKPILPDTPRCQVSGPLRNSDPGCFPTKFRVVFLGVELGTYPLLRSRPAMVPLLQRVTFGKSAKSNQKRSAPPLGTSPRLGVPSLRHCSVGPPRRAVPGPARLSRHPCRDAHCAMPAFGQRG